MADVSGADEAELSKTLNHPAHRGNAHAGILRQLLQGAGHRVHPHGGVKVIESQPTGPAPPVVAEVEARPRLASRQLSLQQTQHYERASATGFDNCKQTT